MFIGYLSGEDSCLFKFGVSVEFLVKDLKFGVIRIQGVFKEIIWSEFREGFQDRDLGTVIFRGKVGRNK